MAQLDLRATYFGRVKVMQVVKNNAFIACPIAHVQWTDGIMCSVNWESEDTTTYGIPCREIRAVRIVRVPSEAGEYHVGDDLMECDADGAEIGTKWDPTWDSTCPTFCDEY